jgi:hypothetical protein
VLSNSLQVPRFQFKGSAPFFYLHLAPPGGAIESDHHALMPVHLGLGLEAAQLDVSADGNRRAEERQHASLLIRREDMPTTIMTKSKHKCETHEDCVSMPSIKEARACESIQNRAIDADIIILNSCQACQGELTLPRCSAIRRAVMPAGFVVSMVASAPFSSSSRTTPSSLF